MTKILFVCTGNIFRSMSAEYAMRKILPENFGIAVSSAGTIAHVEPAHPDTLARLTHHGIDPAAHVQRRVTKDLLTAQDLVIAINTDHKAHLRDALGHHTLLFYEASHGEPRPFPDLCDIYPDWKNRPDASRDYIYRSVDAIVETVPLILRRLPELVAGRA
jgi:protein-tyrosine phosphatase